MRKYPIKEILFFFEAWSLLHISKLLILFVPFRSIASRLGKSQHETPKIEYHKDYWYDVEVAILRASRFTFHKSKCYDQAITCKWMLKRRGVMSTLYFGLLKKESELSAHAWIRVGIRVVTGRGGMEGYTPVAWFGDC
jgi:hypothetical protein